MNADIVTRLRVLNHHLKKLAENESLSVLHLDAFMRCEDLTGLAAKHIKRLRAERDEARRELCIALGDDHVAFTVLPGCDNHHNAALMRGWDCFEEEP
jgi:hypothetical protein